MILMLMQIGFANSNNLLFLQIFTLQSDKFFYSYQTYMQRISFFMVLLPSREFYRSNLL